MSGKSTLVRGQINGHVARAKSRTSKIGQRHPGFGHAAFDRDLGERVIGRTAIACSAFGRRGQVTRTVVSIPGDVVARFW